MSQIPIVKYDHYAIIFSSCNAGNNRVWFRIDASLTSVFRPPQTLNLPLLGGTPAFRVISSRRLSTQENQENLLSDVTKGKK